jgi:DNA-binding FadR family transcriptional regulator
MSFPGRLKATLEEHRQIVEAIAQGDVKAAQHAAEYHMEKSEQTLLQSMEALKEKNAKSTKSTKSTRKKQ